MRIETVGDLRKAIKGLSSKVTIRASEDTVFQPRRIDIENTDEFGLVLWIGETDDELEDRT